MVFGEITTRAKVDYEAVVRKTCKEIGFVSDDVGLDADKCKARPHGCWAATRVLARVDARCRGQMPCCLPLSHTSSSPPRSPCSPPRPTPTAAGAGAH